MYSREQIEDIGQWAAEHGIWVVTDEIYEHLTFGDHEFHSMPVVVPEIADRCVVLNGVAKTYAMTGWRVGWMIGPSDVITAATNLQSHSTSNVSNVAQRAALAAVSGSLDAVAEMRAAFERRAGVAYKMLNAVDGVTCIEPEGAFYAYPNLTGLLDRPIAGRTAVDDDRTGRAVARRSEGRDRPRGGIRVARLRPPVVRTRRRRPRRRAATHR